jgi:hypothetical protein
MSAEKNEPYAQLVASLPWCKKLTKGIPEADRMAAFGLYAAACCFCQANLTDGEIQRIELVRVFPSPDLTRIADLLVSAELFDADEDSYYVHDYLDHNKSREEVENIIEQKRIAGRAGGLAKAKASAVAPAIAPASGSLVAKVYPSTATASATSTERVDLTGPRAIPDIDDDPRANDQQFRACHDALLAAFGLTFLPATTTAKLKPIISNYASSTPNALDRIKYGIRKVKEYPDGGNASGAITVAGDASAAAVGKRGSSAPKVCGVCHGTGTMTDGEGVESPCDYCRAEVAV